VELLPHCCSLIEELFTRHKTLLYDFFAKFRFKSFKLKHLRIQVGWIASFKQIGWNLLKHSCTVVENIGEGYLSFFANTWGVGVHGLWTNFKGSCLICVFVAYFYWQVFVLICLEGGPVFFILYSLNIQSQVLQGKSTQ
jgi:hypothetical protein